MRAKFLFWTGGRALFLTAVTVVFLAAVRIDAQEIESFERVLVPVVGLRNGAFNSSWNAFVLAYNGSDLHVTVDQRPDEFCAVCPTPVLAPGEVYDPSPSPGQHSGAFLYIERPGNDRVTLEARVAALRPPPLPTILVEGPIVRENDFLEGTSNLISIPVFSEKRKLLRIYDAEGRPGSVRVRVWNLTDNSEPLGELDVLLMPPPWDDSGDSPFKPFPASAAISLDLEFPAIRELEDFENLRVEIEPLESGMRYWAFVTVTDNITQQVLMITP